MKKALAYLFPVVVWMGLIFLVSSLSIPPGTSSGSGGVNIPLVNEAYHFSVFLILAILIQRALQAYQWRHATMLAMVVVCVYAIADEVHQVFVPFRAFEFGDVVIDSVGAVMVCARRVLRWPADLRIVRLLREKKKA